MLVIMFYLTDPHIKVAGRLDDVRAAKEKIMQILDTRVSNFLQKFNFSNFTKFITSYLSCNTLYI